MDYSSQNKIFEPVALEISFEKTHCALLYHYNFSCTSQNVSLGQKWKIKCFDIMFCSIDRFHI